MRTTIPIEDALLAQAQAFSGLREDGSLVKAALHALIQRECSLRLASLVGSQRDWRNASHRRDFDL